MKPHVLQHDVAPRVGEDCLFDPVTTRRAGTHDFESRLFILDGSFAHPARVQKPFPYALAPRPAIA
jgi:hypothetical protein